MAYTPDNMDNDNTDRKMYIFKITRVQGILALRQEYLEDFLRQYKKFMVAGMSFSST